ncbi:MAG: hypothetical protein WA364_09735, partial [Candidatus Nitrosopolaris sp.]
MIKGRMNRTANLFVLLIVISFILLATAIRYAQAQPGCCGPATTPPVRPNVGSMANETGGPMANATSSGASMGNTTSGMESNSTANARQENNGTENATSTGMPENATSTGMPENATSTGMPENATS